MASFGLALNLLLWSVPAVVGASAVPHLILPNSAPTLSEMLAAVESKAGITPSLPEALVQLIGAEAEALEVAGQGLQQPPPAALVANANHAGARVLQAVATYVRSANAVFNRAG